MGSLERGELDRDPLVQFVNWRAAAAEAGLREPDAMTLATADPDGSPSARVVLLRAADEHGFTWHTNRSSLKGRDLAANPRGALVFHWEVLERQVRTAGMVEALTDEEIDPSLLRAPTTPRSP